MNSGSFIHRLTITTATASALLLAGCNPADGEMTAGRDTAVCTDVSGKRINDNRCSQQGGSGAWYFISKGRTLPYVGDSVSGGSYAKPIGRSFFRSPPETAVIRPSAITRGGFGSSARSFFHAGG